MRTLLVFASYATITIVLCSPFLSLWNLGAVPVMEGDVCLHLWTISWVNHALRHQPMCLFQANAFHPHPNSLAFPEHFFGGALLVFPWYVFSDNPVYPYNFLFFASYLFSALHMYFLAFYYTRRVGPSWLAGLIYGFCFFRAHHFTHLSLIFNPWMPLVLLVYEKLKIALNGRNWLLLLLFVVLQCLTNWYTAFFVVLILGWRTFFDVAARRLSRKVVVAMVGLLISAALLFLPFYLPYVSHHQAPGILEEVRYNSANLGSYLQPPHNTFLGQWLGTERRWILGERSTYAGYVVFIPVALALIFLIRRQWDQEGRYLLFSYSSLGLFAFFLSLGPYFLDLGGLVSPVRLLYWMVPQLGSLRAVARLAMVVMFCLALLAGLVLSRLKKRTTAHLIPLLSVLFLFEHYPVGLPWNPGGAVPFRPRPVDVWLKQKASQEQALFELPGYSPNRWTRESDYMLYSTQHWLKLLNGYTRFYPDGYFEDQKILSTFPSAQALELLRSYDVDYVMVHADQIDQRQLGAIENEADLILVASFGNDRVFEMRSTDEGTAQ